MNRNAVTTNEDGPAAMGTSVAGAAAPAPLSSIENFLALCAVFDVLYDAVVVVDDRQHIVFSNAAVQRLFGYEPAELAGRPLNTLVPARFHAPHARAVSSFRDQGHATLMGERPVLHALARSGGEVPVSISICRFDLEGARYCAAVIRDAAHVHARIGEAEAIAETDALTGVGNRLHFSRRLQEAMQERGAKLVILFIDLDSFKEINDRYGHKFGDHVLRIVARRIKSVTRARDVVARLGGDEFAVILPNVSNERIVRRIASGLQRRLQSPFHLEGRNLRIGMSIGTARYPHDGTNEADLLHAADMLMYEAKRGGRAARPAPTASDSGGGEAASVAPAP